MKKKLTLDFYLDEDVVSLSKNLLGKFLLTNLHGEGITGGMIVETEAYNGVTDKASHAHGNRRTNRTQIMYKEGGVAYIYMIYGFHFLFNVITNIAEIPHAVLIRAIEPTEGIDTMLSRRGHEALSSKLTSGPGLLSKALGITKTENGESLLEDKIWIEDRGVKITPANIIASPRVNVGYADEDALLPWRFRIKDNPYTSKAK